MGKKYQLGKGFDSVAQLNFWFRPWVLGKPQGAQTTKGVTFVSVPHSTSTHISDPAQEGLVLRRAS